MKAQVKAIEIILGMFILLVVAVVLLSLFRSFFSRQRGQLEQMATEEQRTAAMENALQTCNNLCYRAQSESCSDQKVAEWCLESTEFDLNNNGHSASVEYGSTAGIFSCEQPIYCFQIAACEQCGVGQGVIGAKTCRQKLCTYWQSQGITGDSLTTTLNTYIDPGKCLPAIELENKTQLHWYYLAFGSNSTTC